ncbi:hypothetical protein SCHPADRAFT_686861 [Schizopora paradoxa]|uniref:BTB domain-containing protein n=1 Tax=Schizopora paradoxa TaxID=27342 RepID=A0A0H2R5D6_9AGAM|nr:hypothetical protein SCHPADRAFT_686861 [Schizopora paradoxa]
MSSPPSNAPKKLELTVHPEYTFDDADITLLSADGTLFKVHSCILRMASSVFKDMLSAKCVEGDGPFPLKEGRVVLETILNIMYPFREPPTSMSLSHFREVAFAADKYNIVAVTDALKGIILGTRSSTHLHTESEREDFVSVEKYLLAWDLGWTTVAEDLSSKAISCDLSSEAALDLLLSGDRAAMKTLTSLHRQRRIWLYNAFSTLCESSYSLHFSEVDSPGTDYEQRICMRHIEPLFKTARISHDFHLKQMGKDSKCRFSTYWWKLKAKVRNMLDTDASGDQLLEETFLESLEVKALVNLPCCDSGKLSDGKLLRGYLQYIVDRVPRTIADFQKTMDSYQEVERELELKRAMAASMLSRLRS